MSLFKRTTLSDRQERAVKKTLDQIQDQRHKRFRVLACVDTATTCHHTIRMAASLTPSEDCDLIVLNVRPIDQGLWSGGLQVRVARQNMMDAGFELPGLKLLREALETLKEEGLDVADWEHSTHHVDAWGDPLGDNKVEYTSPGGRSVVLKLKTAPDPASGILDQYELGPYNLIIIGEPSRWRGEIRAFIDAGITQRVTVFAPCSVLVSREASLDKKGFFICTDGTARSMQTVRRSAVLAQATGQPITLFSVATSQAELPAARENVKNAKTLLNAIGIKVREIRTAIGNRAQCIISHGNEFRVIVVSDEGRTKFQRALRGSTAYEVVKGADTSVLDVR